MEFCFWFYCGKLCCCLLAVSLRAREALFRKKVRIETIHYLHRCAGREGHYLYCLSRYHVRRFKAFFEDMMLIRRLICLSDAPGGSTWVGLSFHERRTIQPTTFPALNVCNVHSIRMSEIAHSKTRSLRVEPLRLG